MNELVILAIMSVGQLYAPVDRVEITPAPVVLVKQVGPVVLTNVTQRYGLFGSKSVTYPAYVRRVRYRYVVPVYAGWPTRPAY